MKSRPNLKKFVVICLVGVSISVSLLSPSHSSLEVPKGYVKWQSGKEFAFKWVERIPKDIMYGGVWRGVESKLRVTYLGKFSCSPELPDGTTNSVEVQLKITGSGGATYFGRGFAQTMGNRPPYLVTVQFLGARKGFGKTVYKVEITDISCRM